MGNQQQQQQQQQQQRKHGLGHIWNTITHFREQKNSLALTRVLTDYEAALQIKSPKGLLVHGDVGTGKSMLIDLFADSLPNRKKRRWHFNTFMLDIIYRLEQLRKSQNSAIGMTQQLLGAQDYPLLKVAKDLIQNSPILFLDEFQMPDRTSSKILSTLFTSFFNLGGVLIATSNRMPDELAKASGLDLRPRLSSLESLKRKIGFAGMWKHQGDMFSGTGDFQNFVQLLKARCDVWVMNSEIDYRRSQEIEDDKVTNAVDGKSSGSSTHTANAKLISLPNIRYIPQKVESRSDVHLPRWFYLIGDQSSNATNLNCAGLIGIAHKWSRGQFEAEEKMIWEPVTLTVYGRKIEVPHHRSGVVYWTFAELCEALYGPADYTTLASSFHTFVIFNVPVLTWAQRNEARRFITLLDALYEARCKLMILATASPDTIFFPDLAKDSDSAEKGSASDALHSETFAEAYQDATAPFRPNISSYGSDSSSDSSYPSQSDTSASTASDPGAQKAASPNFSLSGAFVGEDELFAYKRARSRIWEMCSKRWWDRTGDGWWRPLPPESRFWEKSLETKRVHEPKTDVEMAQVSNDDKPATSPFRVHDKPPPKISWTHIWGTMRWGNRAGAWGQGPEGLQARKREPTDK